MCGFFNRPVYLQLQEVSPIPELPYLNQQPFDLHFTAHNMLVWMSSLHQINNVPVS